MKYFKILLCLIYTSVQIWNWTDGNGFSSDVMPARTCMDKKKQKQLHLLINTSVSRWNWAFSPLFNPLISTSYWHLHSEMKVSIFLNILQNTALDLPNIKYLGIRLWQQIHRIFQSWCTSKRKLHTLDTHSVTFYNLSSLKKGNHIDFILFPNLFMMGLEKQIQLKTDWWKKWNASKERVVLEEVGPA